MYPFLDFEEVKPYVREAGSMESATYIGVINGEAVALTVVDNKDGRKYFFVEGSDNIHFEPMGIEVNMIDAGKVLFMMDVSKALAADQRGMLH